MRIYLTGFMGAGKTTVGTSLASALGYPFVDLDAEIEARAGVPIRGLFARDGERRFRRLERDCLAATAAREDAVIATGGGTVVADENRALIRELGLCVWLDVGFETIVARLDEAAIRRRPLFGDREQALSLYNRRVEAYRQADLRVEVQRDDEPRAVAARIEGLLRERQCAI